MTNSALIKGVLFDLEGILVQGKSYKLLPGAKEILQLCRNHHIPYSIITNNTTETPKSLLKILQDHKLLVDSNQLFTPLDVLSKELSKYKSTIVLGSKHLKDFVESHEVEICENELVDAVICGSDFDVTKGLISVSFRAIIEHDAQYLCLHKNRFFVDSKGLRQPGAGCLVVGLEYSTNTGARVLGKPSREFFQLACAEWNLALSNILLISDDPFSDLVGGRLIGYQTAFVGTGKYDIESLTELKDTPDYTWVDLEEVIKNSKF